MRNSRVVAACVALGLLLTLCAFPSEAFFEKQRWGSGDGVEATKSPEVDYYKVLGLEGKREEASEKDIKQSFRRLSRQYHPDVAKTEGDKAKFAEINRAYEVLSDKKRRKMYDIRGAEGLEQLERAIATGDNNNNENVLSQLFGIRTGNAVRGQNMEAKIEVDLAMMFSGGSTQLHIQKQIICRHCKGNGGDLKGGITTCPHCRGNGVVQRRLMFGPNMYQEIQQPCSACNGKGMKPERLCPVCHGKRVQQGTSTLTMELEPGTPENHLIEFEMEADESPDLIPGDLRLHIFSQPHARFSRRKNGLDLETTLQITLKEALLGFSKMLTHLDGKELVKVSNAGVTAYDTVINIPGKGMPKLHVPSERGDLYVKIQFNMPTSLTKEQQQAFQRVL